MAAEGRARARPDHVVVLLLVLRSVATSWAGKEVAEVKTTACATTPVTDKVTGPGTAGGHTYHVMYGLFLLPLMRRPAAARRRKLLEIGLGCGMSYGAGASARLW
eukprot:1422955-Prymnesium_polylepis.1